MGTTSARIAICLRVGLGTELLLLASQMGKTASGSRSRRGGDDILVIGTRSEAGLEGREKSNVLRVGCLCRRGDGL